MSKSPRLPLLLRSSPAQGTGSYGALPVISLSSSPGSPESDGDASLSARDILARRQKGKSTLRQSSTQVQGSSSVCKKKLGRKGTKSHGRETLLDALEGELESGLEPRFNGGIAGTPEPLDAGTSASSALDDSSEESSRENKKPKKANIDHAADNEEYDDVPDNSPYAAVRANVKPTDDTALSINTPRMWFLSMLFSLLGSSSNLFFSLRYPSVSITPIIAMLLAHPIGLLWDSLLRRESDPVEVFKNGSLVSRGEVPCDATPDETRDKGLVRSLRLWLAQGRWNEKEHCCVYIASNVSFGFAFATDVIVEQSQFYNQTLSPAYQILLTISTQILGYAFAGLTRNFLVRPSGMVWPSTLISTNMFGTLHKEENKPADGWKVSRMKFFCYVFGGSALFYFLPGLLMPALSYFSIVTWFWPKKVVVANFFGIASGLGVLPLTFDWSQIAYIGSPLAVPFWAAMNVVAGLIIVMWIIAPIMYYTNSLHTSYMPILSAAVFDNTGQPYNVSRILTDAFVFDQDAYESYSRVFLPVTYVLSYALQFAALTALVTHTALWHGKDIGKQWRRSWKEIRGKWNEPIKEPEEEPLLASNGVPSISVNGRAVHGGEANDGHSNGHANGNGHANSNGTNAKSKNRRAMEASMHSEPGLENLMAAEDVHNRLMRNYQDVPLWWYLFLGATMAAIGIFVVEYFPVHLPWYGLLMALGICGAMFIPIGIVMAITNQQSSLYLICQLICGSVFPGRPVANMVFVSYGYITSTQGLKFSSDLKLGHYMKIPPRILFTLQTSATLLSSLIQVGILNWMLSHIPGICTPSAINGFNCPIARVHFNGSILWGVVGPKRFFGQGELYRPLIWAFLLGAIAPIGVYFLGKRNKHNIWRNVNLPVLFGSLSWIPPATGLNFSVWALICWLFNDVIRKRRPQWWKKYVMTLSAALDSGVAVGVVVIFFAISYPGWLKNFHWWGTDIYKEGCDWKACPYRTVPAGGHFGPDKW